MATAPRLISGNGAVLHVCVILHLLATAGMRMCRWGRLPWQQGMHSSRQQSGVHCACCFGGCFWRVTLSTCSVCRHATLLPVRHSVTSCRCRCAQRRWLRYGSAQSSHAHVHVVCLPRLCCKRTCACACSAKEQQQDQGVRRQGPTAASATLLASICVLARAILVLARVCVPPSLLAAALKCTVAGMSRLYSVAACMR